MLFKETVSESTLDLLKKLQSLPEFSGLRLVGGMVSDFGKVSPLSSTKLMRFLIVNGVKIDIVNYPYPWIDLPVVEEGVTLAGLKDIAAMKLSAIINRGTKKDFIDYYFLLKIFSFEEMIGFYSQKYDDSQLFTALKSLTYYDDAERDPMPYMIKPVDWLSVKKSVSEKVKAFMKYPFI